MKKIKYFVIHLLMNIGMLAEKAWDTTKSFFWWLFAPNAYADLYHDYKTLQKGYDDLYRQWNNETGELDEMVEELKTENEKLRERLLEIKERYEMAEAEDRPFMLPPWLREMQ